LDTALNVPPKLPCERDLTPLSKSINNSSTAHSGKNISSKQYSNLDTSSTIISNLTNNTKSGSSEGSILNKLSPSTSLNKLPSDNKPLGNLSSIGSKVTNKESSEKRSLSMKLPPNNILSQPPPSDDDWEDSSESSAVDKRLLIKTLINEVEIERWDSYLQSY